MAAGLATHRDGPASNLPVLIVGAGPAGLFAASELMRHGVKPRVVEQRTAPHHETRGTAIQPAVLEVLDRGGVLSRFLETGVHVGEVELMGPGLRSIGLTLFGELGCKYPFQCSQPQWMTETILRDHLAQQGLPIEFGVEVKAIEPDADGLTVTLERGGGDEVVRASYLIGAGGSHDVTRQTMGEHLEGETYGGRYIVADARLGLSCPHGRARIIVGRDGFVLCAPLPEGRWIIFVNRDEADQSPAPPDAAGLGGLLSRRLGADARLSDLRWASYFRMHRRVVPRLGDARRFLLGDSAHLSSPMGGEGINSALMDGADVAWKLALVLRGAAKPSLLDTYAIERGLADRHVLEVSNEIHDGVMGLVAMCGSEAGPSVPAQDPAEMLAGLRRRAMFDVSYAGSPIVGDATAGAVGPAPGERFPSAYRLDGATHHLVVFGDGPRLDSFRDRWGTLISVVNGWDTGLGEAEAGVAGGGVVLVRPDGFIGFRAAPAHEAELNALDAHLATYLNPDSFMRAYRAA